MTLRSLTLLKIDLGYVILPYLSILKGQPHWNKGSKICIRRNNDFEEYYSVQSKFKISCSFARSNFFSGNGIRKTGAKALFKSIMALHGITQLHLDLR